ncbi:MAG TPA: NADH-quinone oxidoreductase subunit K [Firmicutes bacterium]|uniref:NADH-quinone oxidoreductase subunit K n=1 Tax=Candidatus Fermentithermobacillus carboniphilus TaxID=3085328 RepID=A0AAT9L9I9_9FIRM|nr:MAG: NADH-quinone oxidoreductase subunit K [Candidatus Fermentithermobacillus carboniphilus]HHW18407.1 NADH-quinone oxidoreductase subunit K [Candidatus Fermentithermobacillaceae bacterium]
MANPLFWVGGSAIAIVMGLGIYALVSSRNLLKMLIGLNILSKAATLALAIGAYNTNDTGVGQSLMIAVMMVEVVVTAVVLSLIVNVYRHYGSLDTGDLKRLSG